MDNELKIIERLNTLIKLVATIVVKEMPLNEQVARLSSVGLQPTEIARILGKTPNHISVTLSKMKKNNKNE